MRMLQKITSETTSLNMQLPTSRLTEQLKRLAASCGIVSGVSETFSLKPIQYDRWKQNLYPLSDLQAGVYKKIVQACSGRALLIEEFQLLLENHGLALHTEAWLSYVQLADLNGDVEVANGLQITERREWRRGFIKNVIYTCKRCGSGSERMYRANCINCGQDCAYCEECLTMGRTRFCSLLILGRTSKQGDKDDLVVGRTRIPEPGDVEKLGKVKQGRTASRVDNDEHCNEDKYARYRFYTDQWGLSEAQTAASLEGLRYIGDTHENIKVRRGKVNNPQEPGKFLIWAVTGAGKTEMIFPFIHYTVARGGRVLIATPRKDVVLELQPRIGRAFANYSVVTLYGGSEHRWEQGQITIATTHQLLRFHEAFDLVIIDEIDAFPYHNNPMLAYAAGKVCKPNGNNILLSATPPHAVRKAAKRGSLSHVRVPVRFHRHPLPVPRSMIITSVRKLILAKKLPQSLLSRIKISIERGAQVFVFVPNIQLVEPMVELLRATIQREGGGTPVCVEGTSSKDPNRTDKVQRFRNRDIRVLVTTTILERGVTIPQSDVFILDADSALFDESALVQMAGRAGRSKEDPAGMVYFAAKEMTKSQKEAIRQIKQMNRIARKQGYLKGGNE
ncbi:DEAD/DEAH box helicase [Paenibacillus sp. SYP-B3998]|uniref:DEAD/DEAH box helicase n=2 Tax=Paenibacillus sp. SYP-B3998 TaxID=2678564 RepID=A0A6G4A4X6_9BACL|nr:DEAD/DEAH box helicase [Paenibacillus sp. SYP-B3998]